MMKKIELIFVSVSAIGHIVSTVEFAKLLVGRDDRFSVTLLIMKLPLEDSAAEASVRDAIHQLTRSKSGRLAGIVVDLLCTSMIDVANELGVPSYVYFASSAACLALMFHLQTLKDHQGVDVTEFANSDAELVVPGFVNPVPARVLPAVAVDKEGGGSMDFLDLARGFREAKGILVNTFVELESHVINSFVDAHIICGVLCFGSAGAFHMDQINEIAIGLENSGHRFLWTVRRPPPKDKMAISSDYVNFEEVLPEGFLDRTSKIGKIIGWAPQTAILAHSAVGGFISHCGWNSTLESIWYGVPVATWPMYAEQQLNAFQIVRELEMGVEIRFDYNMDTSNLVSAQEIESRIRSLMDDSSNIRMKRTKMKEKCMKALTEGGSSDCSIQRLIGDIITNIS
ncbi:putative UDP-glucose flavonoid 3-O-glucosyltransferase 3 [Vitis vinifera]|uniref:Putative UDP-glucose flavonoid 3-O-glucosyltransferase 3 n=1 Tax=Vitis vinifera TaxID=29760 RepID=A0A438J3P8_VITVI|nr:putative UDP-glucose flavonoid 3-O-glucosyltransferase 3 [Vitis vinifera]